MNPNRVITINGEKKRLSTWSKLTGVSCNKIATRFYNGVKPEDIFKEKLDADRLSYQKVLAKKLAKGVKSIQICNCGMLYSRSNSKFSRQKFECSVCEENRIKKLFKR